MGRWPAKRAHVYDEATENIFLYMTGSVAEQRHKWLTRPAAGGEWVGLQGGHEYDGAAATELTCMAGLVAAKRLRVSGGACCWDG